MMKIALLGSGRMAHVYGPKIAEHPHIQLTWVFNPNLASAQKIATAYGGCATDNLVQLLESNNIDSVIIATPTPTHLEYISACAQAGKAIYCEKPLEQNKEKVKACLDVLSEYPVPFMLGFNRRFDPEINTLRTAVVNGEVGDLTFLMSWSREPEPPPKEYIKRSGGYFVDSTIHDIDLLCWIAAELPQEVYATGSCLFSPDIGELGDVDATMTTLKMPSGCLVHINNSRQCCYGFDQRLEAFGSKGMLQTTNQRDDNLIRWGLSQTEAKAPLKHFFLERYDLSFYLALDAFYNSVSKGESPLPNVLDGRNALIIALACDQSRREGKAIKPVYE